MKAIGIILAAIILLPMVAAERLPVIGGDDSVWGEVLNSWLLVGHYENGTLRLGDYALFGNENFTSRFTSAIVGFQNETTAWKAQNTSSFLAQNSFLSASNATAIAGLLQNATINRSIDLSSYLTGASLASYQTEANAWKLSNFTAVNATIEAALSSRLRNSTDALFSSGNFSSNITVHGGLIRINSSAYPRIRYNTSGCMLMEASATSYFAVCP